MAYYHVFSDPTANSLLRVSRSTAVEAGGVFCLINHQHLNDLRQALLFLLSVPTSWKSSIETILVNYLNTGYAHDVFKALRSLTNLRYLRIALAFIPATLTANASAPQMRKVSGLHGIREGSEWRLQGR
jgi:hypothetical protein